MTEIRHEPIYGQSQFGSIVRLTVIGMVYFIASWAGIALGRTQAQADLIWPANGIMLGLILLAPRRRWMSYLACEAFVSILIHNIFHFPIQQSLIFALANTAEILVAAVFIGPQEKRRPDLTQAVTLRKFLLYGVLLAPLVSGAIVEAGEYLMGHDGSFWGILDWCLGDALGIGTMTSLILAMRPKDIFYLFHSSRRWETIAWLVAVLATSVLIFRQHSYPIAFVLFPIILVIVFRLGISGAAIGVVLLAAPGAYFTVTGRGPFSLVRGEELIYSILLMQLFLYILIVMVYVVGAVLAQRLRLQNALEESHAQMEKLAGIDPLTQLPNRRTLDVRLGEEWKRAVRENTCLSLLMADVDHFKSYNDQYGHPAGDALLKSIGYIFGNIPRRSSDFAARYGGEEFAIVLPNTDAIEAQQVAERLRDAVANMPHSDVDGALRKVTISLGVTAEYPHPGSSVETFLEKADRALYAAKHAGRNQVSVWVPAKP